MQALFVYLGQIILRWQLLPVLPEIPLRAVVVSTELIVVHEVLGVVDEGLGGRA